MQYGRVEAGGETLNLDKNTVTQLQTTGMLSCRMCKRHKMFFVLDAITHAVRRAFVFNN